MTIPGLRVLKSLFNMINVSFIFQNRVLCDIREIRTKLFLVLREKCSVEICDLVKRNYCAELSVKYNLYNRQRSPCEQLRSGTLP